MDYTGVSAGERKAVDKICEANKQRREAAEKAGISLNEWMKRDAQRLGEADKAMPVGTRIRVEGHGVGSYERFESHWVGANHHVIRFDDGSIMKIKLNEVRWAVVAAAGFPQDMEPEPEPAPVQPAPAPMPQPAAPDELTHLLCSCGLDKYAAVMAAQGITYEMLPGLDDTSLGLLGFNIGEKMTFRQVWVPPFPPFRFPCRAHIWINVYFVILGVPAALCP